MKLKDTGLLSNFLLHNSDKTKILLLGPQAARSTLSNYIVTLDGRSVTSCTAVKDLGVIINSSVSFETHVDDITKLALFHLRNITKKYNVITMQKNLLLSCSNRHVNKFQFVQNAADKALNCLMLQHLSKLLVFYDLPCLLQSIQISYKKHHSSGTAFRLVFGTRIQSRCLRLG